VYHLEGLRVPLLVRAPQFGNHCHRLFICNVKPCEQRASKRENRQLLRDSCFSVASLCALESKNWKFLPAPAPHNLNPARTSKNMRNRVTLAHPQTSNPQILNLHPSRAPYQPAPAPLHCSATHQPLCVWK